MTDISQKTTSNLGVLMSYTRCYNNNLHASEIARLEKIPQKTVARKLDHLQKEGLINFKRVGRNKKYFLDLKKEASVNILRVLESYKAILFLVKHPKLALLIDEISRVAPIILFGSYAKGNATKSSDVDLVIVSKEDKKVKAILERYPFKFHSYFLSLVEIKKMLKNNEHLAIELVKDHILFGDQEKIIKTFIGYCKK
ncbi:hypothetical protein HOC32_00530 [Candidatus Woesearchaeota archaeon]|jgi:predicted nucleotidyltransferase|nr:hypothetical protein [Candidatus Woesearchaeota archaeon]